MAKNMTPEIQCAFEGKADKYCDLVWYARSHPKSDTAYWEKVPDHIREGALNAQARVEEAYPSEVSALGDNWNHGFNSGCLAAFRYVLTALCERNEIDEFGEEFVIGGLAEAEEEFPDLDT